MFLLFHLLTYIFQANERFHTPIKPTTGSISGDIENDIIVCFKVGDTVLIFLYLQHNVSARFSIQRYIAPAFWFLRNWYIYWNLKTYCLFPQIRFQLVNVKKWNIIASNVNREQNKLWYTSIYILTGIILMFCCLGGGALQIRHE